MNRVYCLVVSNDLTMEGGGGRGGGTPMCKGLVCTSANSNLSATAINLGGVRDLFEANKYYFKRTGIVVSSTKTSQRFDSLIHWTVGVQIEIVKHERAKE